MMLILAGLRKKLFKMSEMKAGAILSYLSLFITITIALTYTPIMLRLLGQSDFGLYALIGSVAAYFSVMDMGLGNAVVRYTARNKAIGDKGSEANLNGMFLILYTIIGLLTIIIGAIFLKMIDNIFGASLTVSELNKAKIMVVVLIVNFALSFPLSIFGSIMNAYEKFIIVKVVGITRSIMIPIITLSVLFLGYGPISMVVITTVINISCLLFNVFYCFKNLKINFYFGNLDFGLLKEILGYSSFIFLNIIVDQIYWNTDQFILGALTGTLSVAVYAIAMQFITIFKMFSTSISNLFLPRASAMVAKNASNEILTETMIKYGRVQYIIMSYVLSGFILFGYQFITIWAGDNYSNAYYIVLIVMIPLTIPLIQNFGISILQAKNLHGFRSIVYLIIAILNILISIPLVIKYDGIGSAVATGLSLILGHIIIINIYYNRKIGINIILFWKNILQMSIPAALALLTGFLINNFISESEVIYLTLN
ncbi:O-antigen/teichoic acid export membrane protein, partial [Rossellomorea aquimaris]